ncbi:leucine-rich repeat domain-containing protein [Candidatus Uabimicrobium sp. HlEnr_7]|uniref:leucine-rich repeat domain-containing protein n=1 Tax=Candidatus Uabimicrobium helgolandensis TaxID=3095367 RepID=UPI003556F9D3
MEIKSQVIKKLQHDTRYINCTFYLDEPVAFLGNCRFENCSFRGEEVVMEWIVKCQFQNCNFNKLVLQEMSHIDMNGGYISHLQMMKIREQARSVDNSLEFIQGTHICQLTWLNVLFMPEKLFNLHSLQVLHLGKVAKFRSYEYPEEWDFFASVQGIPEDCYGRWGIEAPRSSGAINWTETETSVARFSEEIVQLRNLRELDLSNCLIHLIPHELYKLKHLEKLNLASNRIGYSYFWPEENEGLYYDCIGSIPRNFSKMKNLKELDFSHNRIKLFPYHLGYLETLERLDLSFNELTYVAPFISNLRNLKYLGLKSNKLNDIQKEKVISFLPNCKVDV